MDCKTARYGMNDFFTGTISDNLKGEILNHLKECVICQTEYVAFANRNGYVFDIIREISKAELNKVKKMQVTVSNREKYTSAYKFGDFYTLSGIKAVRDIYSSKYDAENCYAGNEDFINYLVKKICQRIDLLEKCYSMEYKE